MRMFTGVGVQLVMPFGDDETVSLDELRTQARHLVGAGVDALLLGSGSELDRLSDKERVSALRAVADGAGGRVPVVAAVGASSTYAAHVRVDEARANGADAILLTPPPGPGEISDLFRYFAEVGSRAHAPIVVLDTPRATGSRLPVDLLVAVARDIPNVSGLAIETGESALKIAAIVERIGDGTVLLGGAGGVDFVRELDCGAQGTIVGPAFASTFRAVWLKYRHGDRAEARTVFERHLPIVSLAARDGHSAVAVHKELLRRRGLIESGRVRRPHDPLDATLLERLDVLLGQMDVSATGGTLEVMTSRA